MSAIGYDGYARSLANQRNRVRRLTVSTMGESHGLDLYLGAAIQYACWRYYNADIYYDSRTYASGGSCLAVGGTTTTGTNGLTTQLTQFQARPTDIAWIASGYNDQPTTEALALTVATTVTGVADSCFAAGAKFVVINGIAPWALAGAGLGWVAYNQLIKNYVAKTPGAFFLDTTSVTGDFQNSGTLPYRNIGTNAAGTYQSYTIDGTHLSGYAQRLLAPKIADILNQIAPLRTPRSVFNSGNFSPSAPHTNILGDAGNCMGTAGIGTNSGFDTGVAGTSSSSRLKLSLSGDMTVAASIVTGSNGERKQRLTVGGTGIAASFLTLGCTPTITAVNNGVSTRVLNFEAQIDLASITGLCDIRLQPLSSTYNSPTFNNGGNGASGRWSDASTESLFAYHLYNQPVPSGNNPVFNLIFMFATGSSPSGTIDVSHINAMIVDE